MLSLYGKGLGLKPLCLEFFVVIGTHVFVSFVEDNATMSHYEFSMVF